MARYLEPAVSRFFALLGVYAAALTALSCPGEGKVESGVKHVRPNLLCGLRGKEPAGLEDLNAQLKVWVWTVANERVHGTTHEQPVARWAAERDRMHQIGNRPPYPYAEDEPRQIGCDSYVAWQFAGKELSVCEHGGRVEI